jgi:SAM-dependent methyltransferase
MFLFGLSVERLVNPGRFRIGRDPDRVQDGLQDPQNWAPYWQRKKEFSGFAYELVAAVYRNFVIRPVLRRTILRTFRPGAALLHAGCGSGQVDLDLQSRFQVTAVDISRDALDLYARYNPQAHRIEQASILKLPYGGEIFDGVYNLGVMEHFPEEDILRILNEFHRVLRPGGKIVIFWPPRHGTSVLALKAAVRVYRILWKKDLVLHPAEISLLTSKAEARRLFATARFDLVDYYLGIRDGFIQAVLTGQKRGDAPGTPAAQG